MISMRLWRIARILVTLALANFAVAALSLRSEAANEKVKDPWREIKAGLHTKVAATTKRRPQSAQQLKKKAPGQLDSISCQLASNRRFS
jgi:hypothetical protein